MAESFCSDEGFGGDWADITLPPIDSEAELEMYLHDRFPQRDFWEDHFNQKILQQILDKYFSLTPGEYVAQKDFYQLKIRLKINCKVCRVDLKGYDPFMSHNNGKAHKKMRKAQGLDEESDDAFGEIGLALGGVALPAPQAGVAFPVPVAPAIWTGSPALPAPRPGAGGVAVIGKAVEGLQIRGLSEPWGIFPDGSLEQAVDRDSYPVVGMSFVKKVKDFHGTEQFVCSLCKFACTSQAKMLTHLRSVPHAIMYFRVKENRHVPEACVLRESELVVIRVGRVNHVVPTFPRCGGGISKEGSRILVGSGANATPLGIPRSPSCKVVVKVDKRDVATQMDCSWDMFLDNLSILHTLYVPQLAKDLHCWSLMLEAAFRLLAMLTSFAARHNDHFTLEHLRRMYEQLCWVYRTEDCVLPLTDDDL